MKKNVFCFAIVVAFSFAPIALWAQQSPLISAVRTAVAQHGKNLVAGAEEMPAGKFGYSPTPQQMTFGHLVLHVAQSNNLLCSRISGDKAPGTGDLNEHSPKAQLVEAMRSSFSFCEQALSKVNDSDLSAEVPFFGGRTITKAGAMIALSNDLADHYAQESIYLRLNGHLPPTAMHGMAGGGRRGM